MVKGRRVNFKPFQVAAMERVLLRQWRTEPSGSGEKLLCEPVPAIRKTKVAYGSVIPGIQVSYRKRPRRDLFDRCGRRNTLRECVYDQTFRIPAGRAPGPELPGTDTSRRPWPFKPSA